MSSASVQYYVGVAAEACHDYQSGESDDLNFYSGDIILLTAQVNSDWLRGQLIQSRITSSSRSVLSSSADIVVTESLAQGMFPASFVRRKGQCKATGQYVFNAECAEDLSVYPGETLFLAEIIDENWVCIENQRGLRGNVPRNFLSAIVVETEESRDPATGLFSNGFGTTTSMNSTKYQQSNQTHAKSSSGIDSFGLNNELPPSASFIQTEHSTNNIHTSASSTQSNSASSPQNHNVTKSSAAPMKAFQPNNYSATSSFGDTFSSNSATTSNSNFGSGGLGMRRAVSQYFPPSDESSGGINTDFVSAWDDDMLEKKDNSVSKRSSGIFGGSGGSLNKSASHSDVRQLGKGKGCSKRESAIEELVGTEKSFCRDVELFLEVFAPSDYHWTALKVDYRSICGNIAQVHSFSKALTAELERQRLLGSSDGAGGAAQDECCFGRMFLNRSEDLIKVYGEYCSAFEHVPNTVEQYCLNKDIQKFFKKGIREMNQKGSRAMNVQSVLLQPVQRVTKYPLMLAELNKHTPTTHPDKGDLGMAVERLQQAVGVINQNKRAKEVIERYKVVEPSSLRNMVSKISVSSLSKKRHRLAQSVTRRIASSSVNLVHDQQLELERTQLRTVEKQLQQLQGSLGAYSRTTATFATHVLSMAHEAVDLLRHSTTNGKRGGIDDGREMYKAYVTLSDSVKDLSGKHVKCVEKSVERRVGRLASLFSGPNNLLKKRDDKLLDYERLLSLHAADNNSIENSTDENLVTAKGNYTALNEQLKQDLPQFNSVLQNSISDLSILFLRMRKNFLNEVFQKYHTYAAQHVKQVRGETHEDIRQEFERRHVEVASQMAARVAFIPAAFSASTLPLEVAQDKGRNRKGTNGASMKKSSKTATLKSSDGKQTEADKERLREMFQHVDLYTCKSIYRSNKPVHVNLESGDLVGVIQRKDPSGSDRIWMVDKGGDKGLVEAVFLSPIFPTSPIDEHDPVVMRQKRNVSARSSEPKQPGRMRPKSMFESSWEEDQSPAKHEPLGRTVSSGRDEADLGMLAPVYKHTNVSNTNGMIPPPASQTNNRSRAALSSTYSSSTILNSPVKHTQSNQAISINAPGISSSSRRSIIGLQSSSRNNEDTTLKLFDPLSDNSSVNAVELVGYNYNTPALTGSAMPSSSNAGTAQQQTQRNQQTIAFNGSVGNNNHFSTGSATSKFSDLSLDSGFGGSPLSSMANASNSHRHAISSSYSSSSLFAMRGSQTPQDNSQGGGADHIYSNRNGSLRGEKWQVLWSHDASTQNEISLREGMVVEVLQKSDLSGNTEWWLVRDLNVESEGYFPALYLQQMTC